MIVVPTAPWAHIACDLVAWSSGLATSVVLYRWRLRDSVDQLSTRIDGRYFLFLVLGAIPGAWLAGSLNSLNEARPALSHSVAGALVGAIVGVEIYKALRGVRGSTGGVFVGSFCVGLIVGRLGCLFTGLGDDTFGSPTAAPWAVDLGDGVPRHPVQVYEALAMLAFLAAYLVALGRRSPWALQRGFYAMCICYGAQRFVWEFLKPYPKLIGPFNLFHVLSLGLLAYGWIYFRSDRRAERTQSRALSFPRPDDQPV